ncbi:MAG TPA: hypothetical protein VNI57_07195, partial [Candidatus Saccharimonadales bacterium]|nr:hypothetical protein [Candidatus Saccharimonadales bacterium]
MSDRGPRFSQGHVFRLSGGFDLKIDTKGEELVADAAYREGLAEGSKMTADVAAGATAAIGVGVDTQDALAGQVAALRDFALRHGMIRSVLSAVRCPCGGVWYMDAVDGSERHKPGCILADTAPAAEAHDRKVRAEAFREAAKMIRDCRDYGEAEDVQLNRAEDLG